MEKDLPSSSEESDVDFVPKEGEDNSDSGSNESDYESSEGENNTNKSRKRKKRSKKSSKKPKTESEPEGDESEEKKPEIDVDALWADFKKDVSNTETKKTADSSLPSSATKSENVNNTSSESSTQNNPSNSQPKGGLNLPPKGRGGGGGLSKLLNQIGKKDKMTTLKKSQLDWNNFKKSEGIEEEIKVFNRGKDGYLEKQDFLQRTDLRQFEIEKDLRSVRRKF